MLLWLAQRRSTWFGKPGSTAKGDTWGDIFSKQLGVSNSLNIHKKAPNPLTFGLNPVRLVPRYTCHSIFRQAAFLV
jgi:hypothetical protein